jgi:hypothetical protein
VFTARTTWVSNPLCAPGLHPSLSDPCSWRAFAVVSPERINVFNHYPICTHHVSRSLAKQYRLPDGTLRVPISQTTCRASYGCFRPNKCGCDLDRWDYRGGWHQSLPVLIRGTLYTPQKILKMRITLACSVILSYIAEVSRLLHPVGLGIVSQIPSQGLSAKSPY